MSQVVAVTMFFITVLLCCTAFFVLAMILDFKREERAHVDTVTLSEALQKELDKISELKTKVDTLALKVGLR